MALILAAANYLPPERLGWLGPSKMHPDKDRHAAICQSRRHLSDTANLSLAPATRLKAAIL